MENNKITNKEDRKNKIFHKLKKDSTGIYLDGFKLKMVKDYKIEKTMGQYGSPIELTVKIAIKDLDIIID